MMCPQITADGPIAAPSDGARKLSARTNFFYVGPAVALHGVASPPETA